MSEPRDKQSSDESSGLADATADQFRSRSHRRFVIVTGLLYVLLWAVLAIDPLYRSDWALENIVVVAGLLVLALTWRYYIFSRFSYFVIALFLALHAIGSHYTYSEVPYHEWLGYLTLKPDEAENTIGRNHFDRLVHFSYGLLLFYPFRECFLHFAQVRRKFWSYLVPMAFILSTSLIYELLEWAAAVQLGGDVGISFLGSQGDVWDAQKDSFCALLGALVASIAIPVVSLATHRDFAIEWIETQRKLTESRSDLP